MPNETNLAVLQQKNQEKWCCGSNTKTQPGDNPGDGKEDENGVAGFLVARVPVIHILIVYKFNVHNVVHVSTSMTKMKGNDICKSVCVPEHLGQLEQVVGAVVDD